MSTYPSLLEPVCRRRQLPPTPVSPIRRSSSPRILPTPPPVSPISADYRCPSALLERRASGRMLPRPPTAEPQTPASTHNSPSPILTPDPIPELPVEVDAPESPVIQRFGDFTSLDHDTPDGTRSQSSSLSPSIEQVGAIGFARHDKMCGNSRESESDRQRKSDSSRTTVTLFA
ncbi:hypothetical protein RB195_004439 [Necator americanus]